VYLIGSGALCALAAAACIIRNRATHNFAAMPRFYRIQTGLFRKYVFSLDHKVIGLQYALTSLGFLLIGFSLAILFRWQLAYPGQPVPVIGGWFGDLNAPGGVMLPEFYNQLVGMHGTIMVFLALVPLSVGAFGN
jgi:cytochrome c oxidase subunit 1